ncbi:MAG: phosphoribosylanthranilate isomerase [Acidiferrobacterales bacterium]
MRIRAKICGITRLADAMAAVDNGADAIGFVFHAPSPRNIASDAANAISQSLPPFMSRVGLFVNAEAEFVTQTLAALPLDLLQFHGEESAEFCASFGRPYIKAIAMAGDVDLYQQAKQYSTAAGLLVDTFSADVKGGSGKTFDWSSLPHDLDKALILAGGLTADNVADAIEQVQPYAVDVSSGVESSKGIKDADKIVAFMKEVKRFT